MIRNKKILFLSSITTYPVKSWWQMRSHFIIKELAKYNTVNVFVPIARKDDFPKFSTFEVNCWNYTETRYINYFLQWITFICERIWLFWISFILFKFILKGNQNLQKKIKDADIIFLNFPHLWFLLTWTWKEIYYISHNVEYELFSSNMKIWFSILWNILIKMIKSAELELIRMSKKTLACTQHDIDNYISDLDLDKGKFCILENGIDKDKINDVWEKPEIYNSRKNNVIFIGSYFKPNIEAVNIIEKLAKIYINYNFFIVWSVARWRESIWNLFFNQETSPRTLNTYLKFADYAINPIITWSGSNLKMLDYFYFWIPVISTLKWLRWFEEYTEMVLDPNNLESFNEIIQKIIINRDALIKTWNNIAESHFWSDLVYNNIIDEKK